MTGLENKWAIVTGASRGIGKEYSLALARYGYNLLLVSNEDCDDVVKEIDGRVKVQSLILNLALDCAADTLKEYSDRMGMDVEVLVNNAGIFFFDSFLDVSKDTIETMLSLHMVTLTKLCRIYAAQMKAKGCGYILNMGSASDILPYPGISIYAATKAYVKNLSISLNQELRSFGVHIMCVRPGAVATGLYGVTGKLQKIGLRTGIMITPEKLVKKVLKNLFNSKRSVLVPRFITYGYIFISRVPWPLMNLIIRKTSLFNFIKK